jgi:hypothetical protein
MTSTSFPRNAEDWRGRFIFDMADSISQQPGIALSLWAPGDVFPPRVANATLPNDHTWLGKMSDAGGIAHLLRTQKARGMAWMVGLLWRLRRLYRQHDETDVVHVNWLQNALPLIGLKRHILITVLGSDYGLIQMPGMKSALRLALKGKRVLIAPNADWMKPALQNAFGDLAEIRTISFGVDEGWFGVQRILPKHPEWLVVSRLTRGKLGALLEWGEGLFGADRTLHLLGPMQENITLPNWVEYHGPTFPTALRDEWFPHMTGLLTLSTHPEGRPQVIIEAMASGLPVIASDQPAHRDLIEHGVTGWLINSRDALQTALSQTEFPGRNIAVGLAARTHVQTNIGTWQNCAQRFVQGYHDLART